MKNIAHLMFELIGNQLYGNKINKDNFSKLTNEDYEKLYKLSKSHDLAHIIGYALDQNKLIPEGCPMATKFQEQVMMAVYRYQTMNYELKQLKQTLEEAKISLLPLKGSVIRDYYPEPWIRTSCDIDILVRKEDLDIAIDAIEKNLSYKTDRVRNYHDVSMFSQSGVHLELHFNIQESMENLDKLLSKIWEYALPKKENSFEYVVTNEFLIYHLVAHMSYHFASGGCGIRPFVDLFVCKNKLQYDDNQVIELCKVSGIDTFYNAVKKTYSTWFDGAESDETTEQITNYVIYGGVYGNSENKAAVGANKSGSKFKYIISRIFIPYDSLKIMFPILQKHKCLLPFCEVARWFKRLFEGKLTKAANEVKTIKNLSKDDSAQVSDLIQKLGL